jgi:hypothetical protein
MTGEAAPSALDGVPFGQPALALAAQLQRRAARAGAPVPGSRAPPANAPQTPVLSQAARMNRTLGWLIGR